jgi:hypothetical protein
MRKSSTTAPADSQRSLLVRTRTDWQPGSAAAARNRSMRRGVQVAVEGGDQEEDIEVGCKDLLLAGVTGCLAGQLVGAG